jgi:DNA adenine methylase
VYSGGKGKMIKKLLPLLPRGKIYVEPYCGSAAMFFAKEPSPIEVLNDLDGNIINFFRCLQNKRTFNELLRKLRVTPYARKEFERAIKILNKPTKKPVEWAWAWFVVANQGFAGITTRLSPGQWGRSFGGGGTAQCTARWLYKIGLLEACRHRLMCAQIDCVDALKAIRYWDSKDTVFYIDPPYLPITRKSQDIYRHDATQQHHEQLVKTLLSLKGQAMLSCYDDPVYKPLLKHGWRKQHFKTSCSIAGRTRISKLQGKGSATKRVPRTETVYILSRMNHKTGWLISDSEED